MMRNLWNLSLGLSIFIHTLALAGLSHLKLTKIEKKEIKIIKIFPQEIKKIKETIVKNNFTFKKPPPYIEKLAKKTLIRKEESRLEEKVISAHTKEVLFSSLPKSLEKFKKNPAYMEYYKLIRERIRRNAYRYYDIDKSGIVYLCFIVLNSGDLAQLTLSKKSEASSKLIDIALRSVKDSAPFPPFPKELNYPQLQFSISIHFKNN